jgi:hypothetical protein
MIIMGRTTTVPVAKATRDKLRRFGSKGETYDEIINRLMENDQYIAFMERQYAILSEKDKFVPLDGIK